MHKKVCAMQYKSTVAHKCHALAPHFFPFSDFCSDFLSDFCSYFLSDFFRDFFSDFLSGFCSDFLRARVSCCTIDQLVTGIRDCINHVRLLRQNRIFLEIFINISYIVGFSRLNSCIFFTLIHADENLFPRDLN